MSTHLIGHRVDQTSSIRDVLSLKYLSLVATKLSSNSIITSIVSHLSFYSFVSLSLLAWYSLLVQVNLLCKSSGILNHWYCSKQYDGWTLIIFTSMPVTCHLSLQHGLWFQDPHPFPPCPTFPLPLTPPITLSLQTSRVCIILRVLLGLLALGVSGWLCYGNWIM